MVRVLLFMANKTMIGVSLWGH